MWIRVCAPASRFMYALFHECDVWFQVKMDELEDHRISTWRGEKRILQNTSHDNLCTGTLLNRIITAQWEGMGDVGSAR